MGTVLRAYYPCPDGLPEILTVAQVILQEYCKKKEPRPLISDCAKVLRGGGTCRKLGGSRGL